MILEICANSYQSAMNAQMAGAHRVELCSELNVGGITPSHATIERVVNALTIPVFVLIRPRSGHFNYNDDEFEIMKRDIEICKDLGCKGIVSGVLDSNKKIDVGRTKILVELSRPLPFTFHRAFDEVLNPLEALIQLMDLGVERLLTSGQKSTALEGLDLLRQLQAQSKNKLCILPGGGINPENAVHFKHFEFEEIHASASSTLPFENGMFEEPITFSDVKKIKSILRNIDG